ncbi:glucoamylase [Rhizobium sp. BK312]|uniref:glucan 1,4-alpha-glucosidase n=1 Tax=Rhizobium sp. BK312 TaxID=2587080 RepID=UPI000DDBE6D0|nr:glucan 1,4-alpha-glucosidase [Rhizobium sp. BK312]MBB3425554.1 glucoamylase [Rhizobium sp. BK312]
MAPYDASGPNVNGIEPRWTSSAKSGVGTALSPACRIWFTLSHGILNEIYYPRVDSACTRDIGLIVTGPDGYFSEEKRDTESVVTTVEDGVPAYRLINTAIDGRYRIIKRIIVDPMRSSLLQQISFEPLEGTIHDYRLYLLAAPHLVNAGYGNTGWVEDYKGTPMLFATGTGGVSMALAVSGGWRTASAGYVGISDGWQQLQKEARLDPAVARAVDGNVALTGEIDLIGGSDTVTVSLGFGSHSKEAGYNALASLQAGYENAERSYVADWRVWQDGLLALDEPRAPPPEVNRYRISTAVLATHRPLSFEGPAVASLSIPWGFAKGDEDLGGYHLVWPRDLVETAGGFLAAGASQDALRILAYLRVIQEEDGHWPQNCWLDGEPYWSGIQMDECAFPILLADALRREGVLTGDLLLSYVPMVESAARYVVVNGPVTGEDRWEEDGGFSPFTLAVEIAALLAAADILEIAGQMHNADYLRQTADAWNDQIERWTYVSSDAESAALGVKGYYVRIAPPEIADGSSPADGFVPIKNRPPAESFLPTARVVSPDALALVRFGLRAADDPRILDTVKVIDAQLKCDLPQGSLWYRYTGDGYGEHEDGGPFDGTGIGRPWPLLAGERAHYELAAGRPEAALGLLKTLEQSAGQGGLLPEQVWDQPDIPELGLALGKPSGSAMPLVWAHAEHIKLLRSLRDGAVFDMPPQGVERYLKNKVTAPFVPWRFNNKLSQLSVGKRLRIEVMARAIIRWSVDGWASASDTETSQNGFGIHVAELSCERLPKGGSIAFTFYWPDTDRWEGEDFSVSVVEAP